LILHAAGCFWGVEKYFRKQFPEAIIDCKVGYCGGETKNPSYKQVCTGTTNHAEVLQIDYDTNKVKYSDLLNFFWRVHDPTTINRQGNDVGTQYRSVIFYHSPEQESEAHRVLKEVQQSGKWNDPIVTQIVPEQPFYTAEEYHQKYLEVNPSGYCNHRIHW